MIICDSTVSLALMVFAVNAPSASQNGLGIVRGHTMRELAKTADRFHAGTSVWVNAQPLPIVSRFATVTLDRV